MAENDSRTRIRALLQAIKGISQDQPALSKALLQVLVKGGGQQQAPMQSPMQGQMPPQRPPMMPPQGMPPQGMPQQGLPRPMPQQPRPF